MRIDSNGMRKTKSGPGKFPVKYPIAAFGGPDHKIRRKNHGYIRNIRISNNFV